MPHITIECSSNVEKHVDLDAMVQRVHEAAIRTGVFAVDAIRSRVHVLEHYRAGGAAENAFVHVTLRCAPGRDLEVKQRVVSDVFDDLCDFLQPLYDTHPLAISLELNDLEETRRNKNNVKSPSAAGR
jgi:5-carboxymethyl-2-hydroxymuconate isomerase